MDGQTRRNRIIEALEGEQSAIKGSSLAERYGVSRQVIVQDIALLRAQGHVIISTAEGYLIPVLDDSKCTRVYYMNHDNADVEEELNLFVDNGGHVLNIIVDHLVYGEISVDLMLRNRRQVKAFIDKTAKETFVPLMSLSDGYHYHTIEADSEEVLDMIEAELREKGFLAKG